LEKTRSSLEIFIRSLSFIESKCNNQPVVSFLYSSAWPSCLTDLLSLRLVGAVVVRNYVRSSFSLWMLSRS